MQQSRSASSSSSATASPKKKTTPSPPRPSSSILLLSPTNEVLLLHRVQTSSSFPSAHVFPGGNCESFHDGEIPDAEDASGGRHADGPAYRWAGVRECFEESGILLAKREGEDRLAKVDEEERERARRDVHAGKRKFGDVLKEWDVKADVDNLIPFTRWITPTNAPKRFTTQMYLYLMPLPSQGTTAATADDASSSLPLDHDAVIPTPDGGVEHTAARFLPAHAWLDAARAGDIILFPPQFFLLHLVAQHVKPSSSSSSSSVPLDVLRDQRAALLSFIREGGWGDKCISPAVVGGGRRKSDGRVVLALDKPGPELAGKGRAGVSDYVVLVDFTKEGPRRVEVGLKNEVLAEERGKKEGVVAGKL